MLRVAFTSEFKRGKLADLVALLSGRTTIRNPNPGSELVSFDYVSLSANAAPFLLGVTVEQ